MESNNIILDRLSNVTTIPTLPLVIKEINRLLNNPKTSADEIGKVITKDQAIAAKVLKLVNSAFYGLAGRVSTITHAVAILGFTTIKNITLTASIFESLKSSADANSRFDMSQYWYHSVACGAAAQVIARRVGYKDLEEAFIAGLIHDIGKVILCQNMSPLFNRVLEVAAEKNLLLHEAENAVCKTTHQEVGGFLIEKWRLPQALQSAVLFHHRPNVNHQDFMITAIVHFADVMVNALDYGSGGNHKVPVVSDVVWEQLKITETNLPDFIKDIHIEVEKASVFLQI